MQTLVIACLASFITAMAIIRSNHWHTHLSSDNTCGVQKFHSGAIPRIGGLAVLTGLITAVGWRLLNNTFGEEAAWLFLATLPAFLSGLMEDITKRVGVTTRLLATIASAGLGAWTLGAVLPRLGVPGLDTLMEHWPLLAWGATLLAVAGLANAVNIIDGFNGLAAATTMLMFMAFGYVAWSLGDLFIVHICLAMIGALTGFFVWNYPRGLIFLGDGGAYLTGFMLGEVAVLLVARHPDLSPWFLLLVCAYPITETLFSIYRRAFLRGMSPGLPDALHLHTLIYRRLLRWTAGPQEAQNMTTRNSATSPYLWALSSLGIIPAVLFWRDSHLLVLSTVIFVATYVWLYIRLVSFRAPRWLSRRVG